MKSQAKVNIVRMLNFCVNLIAEENLFQPKCINFDIPICLCFFGLRLFLTQCFSLELFSFQIYFSFTGCTMEYIVYNWLRNIRPHLFEVVWTDFGMELPCEYISCCLEWSDSLKVKVISQLKGWMGLDSNKSHRSKRPSGLDFAKFRQCHAIFQVKCCNTLLGSVVLAPRG